MSYADMYSELRGSVPKLSIILARTFINRAWKTVREANLWSFNLFEHSWITPGPVSAGTVTVTQGSPTITFDATATTALNAGNAIFSLITQRQFRIGVGGIYNIIAYNSSTGVATLDRMYGDPSASGSVYQVYQLYYMPPMQDFLTWISVRNPQMFLDLGLDMTRAEVDQRDPQRSWYQFPTEVIPFMIDQRGSGTANASATLGFPMFELWGQPVSPFTYQCYGIRRGTDLVNPNDTLPAQVGEDVVIAKGREYAYEWAEANRDMTPRASSPDFKFLMGKAADEYKKRLIVYRKQDKEYVDNWFKSRNIPWGSRLFGYYNTIAGVGGPYAQL